MTNTQTVQCPYSHGAKAAFDDFVVAQDHPCIMAQSVFKADKYDFHLYNGFGQYRTAQRIYNNLLDYISRYDFSNNEFLTFIAAFDHPENLSEQAFETLLWNQLQLLHEVDRHDWDEHVSDDPQSEKFSFSLGGHAFYIVGLHPNSSRPARRSPYPAMVFNLHSQFDNLREMGAYQRVRDKIRKRDQKQNGSINPMMNDFGNSSEARQYSGRHVDASWKCPFLRKKVG